MATPKKRQKLNPDVIRTMAERSNRRFIEARLSTSLCQPSEDLFRKLPPELRNIIYGLVFEPKESRRASRQWRYDISIKSEPIMVHYRRGQRWSHHQEKFSRWREPGLLRAAKWIRQEAKLIYFRSAHITISLRSKDVGEVCAWLRAITDGDDNKSLRHVKLYLMSATFEDIHTWLPLAKLFRDYDIGCTLDIRGALEGLRAFCEYGSFGVSSQIDCALKTVITMGLKAKQLAWDEEYLQMVYEGWVPTQIPGAKRRRLHSGRLRTWREKLADGMSPCQRRLGDQIQRASSQEQACDRDYRSRAEVRHWGTLQMNLRSREAGTKGRKWGRQDVFE
ncbi:hypothetical protein LTR22_021882 [Elasticomyces elasticus]|nr:hypothetical protein LTR22_021882 [Elasticomyces elasticus]